MTSPGWGAAIGCAVLLVFLDSMVWVIVSMASDGNRSRLAGIRLAPLMTSDQAWRTGHRAARSAMRPVLLVAGGLAVVSIVVERWPVVYMVTLGLSLFSTIASGLWGCVAAVGAVKTSTPHLRG